MDIKTITSLIRVAIDPDYAFNCDKEFSQDDYAQLYKLSKKHDAVHLVAYGLQKSGLKPKDTELIKKFRKGLLFAAYRVEQIERAQKGSIEILSENQIPFILLKGAVARDYYPEPWMRTSYDVDILIKKEDFDKAVKAFDEKGYTISKKSAYDILIIAPNDVHVELHFNFMCYSPKIKDTVAVPDIWEKAVQKSEYEYALTDEMFYYFHVSHMAKHVTIGGCGLKPFIDMYLLYQHDNFNKSNSYIKEIGLENFEKNARHLFNVWFYDEKHNSITQQLENYIFSGGAYGSLKNKVSVGQIRTGGKKTYILSRLFMRYDVLKGVFPILKKHKWLTPLFQVVRWFKVIFSGRMGWSMKELMLSGVSTKSDMNETIDFLERAGL